MPNEDSKPSPSRPIEILLVDDHPQVRKLLCEMIKTYDDLCIVGEAVNGEEAVLLASKLKPAAVVMDVHLAVIGLTAGGPQEDERAMIIAGAAVVINKSNVLNALRPAILNAVEHVKNPEHMPTGIF